MGQDAGFDKGTESSLADLGDLTPISASTWATVSLISIRDAPELERDISAFARGSNGGLVVSMGALAQNHRELIIALAELRGQRSDFNC